MIPSSCSLLISLISHSQNIKDLVCGLSTLNIFTPLSIQKSTILFNSIQRFSQSAVSKFTGKTSWYFLGGFSAYCTVPSGRQLNHWGCSFTYGWSWEHWIAKSIAISIPNSWALFTRLLKSSMVPNSGCRDLWPPSPAPIAHGDPGSFGAALVALFTPFLKLSPIGWTGGR